MYKININSIERLTLNKLNFSKYLGKLIFRLILKFADI